MYRIRFSYGVFKLDLEIIFQSLFSRCLYAAIGLPPRDAPHKVTIKLMRRYEYLANFFGTLRSGLAQYPNIVREVNKTIDIKNWFVRINYFVNMIRIIIYFKTDDIQLRISLGDPLLCVEQVDALLILVFYGCTFLFLNHELSLFLERKFKFVGILSEFHEFFESGLDQKRLLLTNAQLENFQKVYHVLLTNTIRLSYFLMPFIILLYNYPVFSNPVNYKIPGLLFNVLLWTISLTFTVSILVQKHIYSGSYIIATIVLCLFQFRSLNELIGSMKRSNSKIYTKNIPKSFLILNHLNFLAFNIRYMVLNIYTAITSVSILFIYVGFIARTHSDMISNLLAILGSIVLIIIGLSCIMCGELQTQFRKIYCCWHRILRNRVYPLDMYLKIEEIQERLTLPTIGIQIGDAGVLTKRFFFIFALEVASSIMLIKCNFGYLF